MYKPNVSGTKEWSVASVNCLTGCSHDCRYCYARERALRFHQVASPEAWRTPRVQLAARTRRYKCESGPVMFPTTHDLLPEHLDVCLFTLRGILAAGNQVLLVTKPHLAVVETICRDFAADRDRILWRFTIGSPREDVVGYWEPGAPPVAERLASLRCAFESGYGTSVSAEPLLSPYRAPDLVALVDPFVSETIWIGKMNQARKRCGPGTSPDAISAIEDSQSDEAVHWVYAQLDAHPKIRWKESYRHTLGIMDGDENSG